MVQSSDTWQSADDVESDLSYQALLVAAKGKPEKSMGTAVIPAEAPDWSEVLKLASQLQARKPQHAGILTNIVKAEAGLNGFHGLCASLEMLVNEFSANWQEVLPQADELDADEPYWGRTNYLRELSEQPELVDHLYRLPLVSVRAIGEYSARDIDIAAGVLQSDEAERERCQYGLIKAAFDQVDQNNLVETAKSLTGAQRAVQALEALFAEKSGGIDQLLLSKLKKRIADTHSKFMEYAENRLVIEEEDQPEQETAVENLAEPHGALVSHTPAVGQQYSLSIENREEAVDVLVAIIDYYQKFEPSSPVIILVHRALKMIPQSYFELLQQLAPDHQSTFADLVAALQPNPLAYLISDSYQRFVAGEKVLPATALRETHAQSEHRSTHSTDTTPTSDVSVDQAVEPVDEADDQCESNSIVNAPEEESPARIEQVQAVSAGHSIASTAGESWMRVGSRRDVMAALSGVENYFIASQPSSPIPLLMQSIQKLVSKSFTELIEQFAVNKPSPPEAGEQSK